MLAMSEALISKQMDFQHLASVMIRFHFKKLPYSLLHPIEVHQRQATANRLHTEQVLSAHIPFQLPGLIQNDEVVRFKSQLQNKKKDS